MSGNVLSFPAGEPEQPKTSASDPFSALGASINAMVAGMGDKTVGEAWDELRAMPVRDVWVALFPEYGSPQS